MLQIFNLSILTVTRWILILVFIMSFHNISNQKLFNIFGIFKIWRCHTHIFLSQLSFKLYFFFLAYFFEIFLFFSLSDSALFYYLPLLFYNSIRWCLFCINIPNFIGCCINIFWNYTFIHNFSIFYPDFITIMVV